MASFTIYGVRTIQQKSPDGKHTWFTNELDQIDVELMSLESWRAPLGFSVTEIKVNL